MDPVTIFLLCIAAVFLIGTVGDIIADKTSVPAAVWLILAGVALRPLSGLVTREDLVAVAPFFAAFTLVFVLFEGGSNLKVRELWPAVPRAGLLSLLGFVLSGAAAAALTMLASALGWLPEGWTLLHGVLAGTILAGTSSVVLMTAMGKANLPPALLNLVRLDSAFSDALGVVGASAIIDVMRQEAGSDVGLWLLRSLGIGLGAGLVAGLVWLLLLRFIKDSERAYPITLAALVLLYVGVDRLGGSAPLAILAVAIILGNAPSLASKIGLRDEVGLGQSLVGFQRQMTFIIQSFFFVSVGALLGPPWSLLVTGVLLGAALLGTRVLAVKLATAGSTLDGAEKRTLAVSIPRGMSAGALATMPITAGIAAADDLPLVVFACVATTIAIFAVGFPLLRPTFMQRAPAPAAPAQAEETAPAETPATESAALPSPAPAPAGPSAKAPHQAKVAAPEAAAAKEAPAPEAPPPPPSLPRYAPLTPAGAAPVPAEPPPAPRLKVPLLLSRPTPPPPAPEPSAPAASTGDPVWPTVGDDKE